MALKRNGVVKKNGDAKGSGAQELQRNGNGVPDHVVQELIYRGRRYPLTVLELKELEAEDRRTVEWLKDLSGLGSFSREWILTCLEEITLQSMGKKPHPYKNGYALRFMPGTANRALKLMAEIQGFNIWKLTRDGILAAVSNHEASMFTSNDVNNAQSRLTELQDTTEKDAQEMLVILAESGAFNQENDIDCVDAEIVE